MAQDFHCFSYFDKAVHIAIARMCGEILHSPWQLEPFGLALDSFDVAPGLAKRDAELIEGGLIKEGNWYQDPQDFKHLHSKACERLGWMQMFASCQGAPDLY